MTPHNEANKNDIKSTVLMPGDPLRAKYIAENFLTEYKIVNNVRNMTAYTGKYKGKEITVFPSGMGMPSIGIYAYELYKFYDVENIIRIGSCGAYDATLNIFDTILVDKSYTKSNFAYSFNEKECHIASATKKLNEDIFNTAQKLKLNLIKANVICSEIFDYYVEDINKFINSFPKDLNITAAEMESFALFYIAKYFHKNAATLLTVVDSHYKNQVISAEQREKSLNAMIKIALETSINEK